MSGQTVPCGTSAGEKLTLEAPPEYLNWPRAAVASSVRGAGGKRTIVVSKIRYEEGADQPSIRSFVLKEGKWLPTRPFIPLESRHSIELMTLVRSRAHPNKAYTVRNTTLLKSDDGGRRWKRVAVNVNGLPLPQFVATVSGSPPAKVEIEIAAIDPSNSDTIFASFVGLRSTVPEGFEYFDIPGLYVSKNGGEDWSLFSGALKSYNVWTGLFPVFGISPSNPKVMLGRGDQGLVVTKDGGRNWRAVGQQRELETPVELAGRKEALEKLKKHGIPFKEKVDWNKLDVYQVEFQWNDERVIYLGTSKGIYRSSDLGETWRLLDVPVKTFSGTNSLVTNLDNPLDLLVGAIDGAYLSSDGGCHFKKIY